MLYVGYPLYNLFCGFWSCGDAFYKTKAVFTLTGSDVSSGGIGGDLVLLRTYDFSSPFTDPGV